MASAEPLLVYHGRSLSEANGLVNFLCEKGMDARLLEGDPLGHTHPASHVYHDVMVVNADPGKLRVLTAEWESLRTQGNSTGSEMFCYHCGHELAEPAAACPICKKSLVD